MNIGSLCGDLFPFKMEALVDAHNRKINYLRISITDRCNLRCRYCMPQEGVSQFGHAEVLRYEEIQRIAVIAARRGISKIRITGGEPLVRKKVAVTDRFERIKAPLLERQKQLEKKKEAFQFRRDIEDEKLWIDEKLPLANSGELGNSLFNVNMLKKKNQSLSTEIDNH